jgi:hypothetical protein
VRLFAGDRGSVACFFFDLLSHGAQGPQLGGLCDRQGRLHVVFDGDGTRQVVRQRALTESPDRPAARRRAAQLAAPGYTGRKRGEVVRTRLVVQQAHTREWLGTFGEAGNGERWPRFTCAAHAIAEYMRKHGLTPADALLRLDGEFGWARTVLLLAVHGVGYLMRCVDYRLLKLPLVREALAQTPQLFEQEDTGTVREVFDVGQMPWTSEVDAQTVTTRLIVTRSPISGEQKPKVGQRDGDWVYELFVTDRAPKALSAVDVLSLLFARGGFEQTLSEEDKELEPDRWVSGHPHGQEAWQILAQWVWNLRLQLGLVARPCAPRVTLWSNAQPSGESAPDATAGAELPTTTETDDQATSASCDAEPASPVECPPAAPTQAVEPAAVSAPEPAERRVVLEQTPQDPSAHEGFALQPNGTLLCPENKVLRRSEVRRDRIRYRARNTDCRACPRAAQCLGEGASGRRGRRVDLPAAAAFGSGAPIRTAAPRTEPQTPPVTQFEPPPRPGPLPVLWYDLPATALRRLLPTQLRQQRVDGLPPPAASPAVPRMLRRDERAHRRLSWRDRLLRNARPASAPTLRLHLHGIPASLAAHLGVG